MTTPVADAFGAYLVADITRLILSGVGVFMVLLCAKVAWMRAKAARDDPLRERSPLALLSYGLFCVIPTSDALHNLGQPADVGLIVLYALALVTGLVAAFGQVTIKLWRRTETTHKEHR